MKIRKWKLTLVHQIVSMPKGATILSVQSRKDRIQMWAIFDELEQEVEPRIFVVHSTGTTIPDDPGHYLGTCQTDDGDLVWHVFEEGMP